MFFGMDLIKCNLKLKLIFFMICLLLLKKKNSQFLLNIINANLILNLNAILILYEFPIKYKIEKPFIRNFGEKKYSWRMKCLF